MLTRLYVDNYKAFSNFEYHPAANELLLGRNGTGKSSLFEVLGILRSLIVEDSGTHDGLGSDTLTRWDTRGSQRFEIDTASDGGEYQYAVSVEHGKEGGAAWVTEEALRYRREPEAEWLPLLERTREEAHVYDDDHATGPGLLVDWSRSAISLLPPRRENRKLTWFREQVASIHRVQVDPRRMGAYAPKEDDAPSADLGNYASWYRHLLQEDLALISGLTQHLRDAIEGFETFALKDAGDTARVLRATVSSADGASQSYALWELSDGQRALIGLYTIAAVMGRAAGTRQPPVTFCIDEPENYVALAELQPWIHEIEDLADGQNAQVLIASHHPEFINHYAHTQATLFYRERGGPVRTRPFTAQNEDGILPAELVARGWEDE